MTDDDLLLLIDDENDDLNGDPELSGYPFKVLIVDDDSEVHSITRYSLEEIDFLGSPLTFLSAYSAAEARKVLESETDIALIFLDVVMETDDAGLRLVKYIREDLDNWLVRIILRTGQPGQAPEKDVITNFDINDYKAKTELTSTRLFTATLSSLRTYRQLKAVEMNHKGLEKILESSSSLFKFRSMAEFAQGVVLQINSFIDKKSRGVLLCAISDPGSEKNLDNIKVIAGTDDLESCSGVPINQVMPKDSCDVIQHALVSDENIFNEHDCAIVFQTQTQATSVVYLSGIEPLSIHDKKLLEIFCSKVAIGFDNINYYDELQYKNTHDLLTGLLNRTTFIEQVDELKKQQQLHRLSSSDAEASTSLSPPCLVVLGIDRFRDINNDLGYLAGDDFLLETATRLQDFFKPDEQVLYSRLGADEFAIYISEGIEHPQFFEALRKYLTQPAKVRGEELIPSISIGHVMIKNLNRPCYELLAETEDALLSAKHVGGNRCIEAHSFKQKSTKSRLLLTRELTYALQRDELVLYYQPIIHGQSGKLAGFEALLRWHHPEHGVITPGSFIEQIETTDLMISIGDWVLQHSMDQAEKWNQLVDQFGDNNLSLSVSVSARQIMVSDLDTQIKTFIENHNIVPDRLRLEITESLIMEDIDKAESNLNTIKNMGVMLSLDDFGTGYSSMSYLNRLPFDTLKLDRSFIANMLHDDHAKPIINFIIKLAHELGISVVAEGVETKQQFEILAKLGCDYLQGYLFGHPMPVDKATDFIRDYDAKHFHL